MSTQNVMDFNPGYFPQQIDVRKPTRRRRFLQMDVNLYLTVINPHKNIDFFFPTYGWISALGDPSQN